MRTHLRVTSHLARLQEPSFKLYLWHQSQLWSWRFGYSWSATFSKTSWPMSDNLKNTKHNIVSATTPQFVAPWMSDKLSKCISCTPWQEIGAEVWPFQKGKILTTSRVPSCRGRLTWSHSPRSMLWRIRLGSWNMLSYRFRSSTTLLTWSLVAARSKRVAKAFFASSCTWQSLLSETGCSLDDQKWCKTFIGFS